MGSKILEMGLEIIDFIALKIAIHNLIQRMDSSEWFYGWGKKGQGINRKKKAAYCRWQ